MYAAGTKGQAVSRLKTLYDFAFCFITMSVLVLIINFENVFIAQLICLPWPPISPSPDLSPCSATWFCRPRSSSIDRSIESSSQNPHFRVLSPGAREPTNYLCDCALGASRELRLCH